jgi:hypothetical protein
MAAASASSSRTDGISLARNRSQGTTMSRSIADHTRRIRTRVDRWTVDDIVKKYDDPASRDYDYENTRLRVPSYQRLWSWKGKRGLNKQRDLIDSILHGYPVPAIILNKTQKGGNDFWDIYDGRHRVETLWRFVNRKFFINYGDTNVYFDDLCERDQERIRDTEFPVIETVNANINQLAEIFIRLNSGSSLKDKDMFWANSSKPLVRDTLRIMKKHSARFEDVLGIKVSTNDELRPQLSNWVGLINGLNHKSAFEMTSSYVRLSVNMDEDVNEAVVDEGIRHILDMFSLANDLYPGHGAKIVKKGGNIGYAIAFYYHDLIVSIETGKTIESVNTRWAHIVGHLRNYTDSPLLATAGAQNLNSKKVLKVVNRVYQWVRGEEIPGVPVGFMVGSSATEMDDSVSYGESEE